MRWNCPHCATALAVSDDKLASGWNYSRCFKCSQFSMIRKSEAAAAATSAIATAEAKPTEAPASVAAGPTPPAPNLEMALPSMMNQEAVKHFNEISTKLEAANMPGPAASEIPAVATAELVISAHARRRRALQFAITTAGLMAISSGIYLFSQGQQLWQKARAGAQLDADRIRTASASVTNPTIVADAADLTEARKPASAAPKIDMIDAPPTASITLTDEVQKSAMAPVREEPTTTNLSVRVTGKNVALRTGPGTIYPAVAIGNPAITYHVLSWKGPWFRIGIPTTGTGEKVAWIRNDFIEINTSGAIEQ